MIIDNYKDLAIYVQSIAGRNARFKDYWFILKDYCEDKNIAFLAESLWWGHVTGRTFTLDPFIWKATVTEMCKFLVKHREVGGIAQYEEILRKLEPVAPKVKWCAE